MCWEWEILREKKAQKTHIFFVKNPFFSDGERHSVLIYDLFAALLGARDTMAPRNNKKWDTAEKGKAAGGANKV